MEISSEKVKLECSNCGKKFTEHVSFNDFNFNPFCPKCGSYNVVNYSTNKQKINLLKKNS